MKLEDYSMTELRAIAKKMDLRIRRSKNAMIETIRTAEHKKKADRYTRIHQIGEKGKEGTTYLAVDRNGRRYAMKTFRKAKSSRTLQKEFDLQKKAAKVGIAPKVYYCDLIGKWFVMEKMDYHLYETLKEKGLNKKQQERIIEIFEKLDRIGVFHNDANLMNYMVKKDQIYLIDYGYSKEITTALIKKLETDRPNSVLMLVAFIYKIKDLDLDPSSYKYLLRKLDRETRVKYNLN